MLKILTTLLVLSTSLVFAQYGTNPPRQSGNPKAGETGVPRKPTTGNPANAQPSLGRFMQVQVLVVNVLRKANVRPDRFSSYKEALIKACQKEPQTLAWLNELNDYFDSETYRKKSLSEQQKDQFEARVLIEMTITHVNGAQ